MSLLVRRPASEAGSPAERLERHQRQARGAYAPATERALASASRDFTRWCGEAGLEALSAAPETVAAYLDAAAVDLTPATLSQRVWAIGRMHEAGGLENPCRSQAVTLALRRIRRAKRIRQRQAVALREGEVAAILATTRGEAAMSLRDRAILLLMRDGMLRRSELVAVEAADLSSEGDGSARLLLRRSKTDQEGRGLMLYVSPECWQAIEAWRSAAGIEAGPVFVSLRGSRTGGPLDAQSVSRILKRLAGRAGRDAGKVSGHSPRIGMAQDVAAGGASLPE